MNEQVILVDKDDNEIGTEAKLKAHREGKLHRAFSIFVFNSDGNLLLQKRAKEKYHSGGLWTNTCCSHPKPNESIDSNIHLRLKEELGFDCDLTYLRKFTYKAAFENGLIENEIDHIFTGTYNGVVQINPDEVSDYKWVNLKNLREDIKNSPENYTPWLKIALNLPITNFK